MLQDRDESAPERVDQAKRRAVCGNSTASFRFRRASNEMLSLTEAELKGDVDTMSQVHAEAD